MQDINYMTDEQISIKYNDFLTDLKRKHPDKKRGELIEKMRNGEIDYHAYDLEQKAISNRLNAPKISSKPTVECPYCHSTNTKKISGTTRFVSTGLFGLASNKIGKNFHCNNCKSDF